MAILTDEEKTKIRQQCSKASFDVDYKKEDINVAAQAVEDFWTAKLKDMDMDIDTATSPVVLSQTQKDEIKKHWLLIKHNNS